MRTYELTFIVDAQLAQEAQEEVLTKLLDLLKAESVELVNMEKWGKKKLAYPIKDSLYGHYVMIQFNTTPDVLPKIEHFLKLSSNILRYLILLRDQRTLKLMKLEAERLAHEAMVSAEKVHDTAEAPVSEEPGIENGAEDLLDGEGKADDPLASEIPIQENDEKMLSDSDSTPDKDEQS